MDGTSYLQATARERIALLADAATFDEFATPARQGASPYLALLGAPTAFDDGVAVGRARIGGMPVFIAAQDGAFMGGAIGEVHGAKITGLLRRAVAERPRAVLLLADSGGVRLHEANAGLVGVAEVLRAVLDVRAAGIPVIALVGGANGAFGGMGIVARCCNAVIMSEHGRLAMSGPEVIESAQGKEEFDAADRALVWRTAGGKHRRLLGDCHALVDDDVAAFRAATLAAMAAGVADGRGGAALTPALLEQEHALLASRLARFGHLRDPLEIWQALGVPDADAIPAMPVAAFNAMAGTIAEHAAAHGGDAPFPAGAGNDGHAGAMNATGIAADTGAAGASGAAGCGNTDRTGDTAGAAGAGCTGGAGDLGRDTGTAPDNWRPVAARLFPDGHRIVQRGAFLCGGASAGGQPVAVIGTCGHTPIGVEIALAQARAVLDTMSAHPGRPIVLLVDTQGQRLRHRDEMLGIHGYMAHLGKALDLARRRGHRIVALVYGQALSGGFVTSGLMADACYALPHAAIRVMALPAMARIIKVPLARLEQLAQAHPVFAPGPENCLRMGGLAAIWDDAVPLHEALAQALRDCPPRDLRAAWGLQRRGRLLAAPVIDAISGDAAAARCA